jgi:pseudouridine synthase
MSITLIEGKNREIRRVLEHFSIRVKNLIRTRIGTVTIDGLAYGESRELGRAEVASLLGEEKHHDNRD